MPSPSAALSTQRPDIASSFEEFGLLMNQQGFIANQVLPVVEVAKQAGNFGIIPLEQLLQHPDTVRAPGSAYNRTKWKFETSTYACEEYGIEEPIDDRESKMYEEYFDAEVVAAQRALHSVMAAYELRVAAAVFNATTWAAATTGITNEWDDAANAVPLTDVEAAVQAVYAASGLWPNALIINRKVFRNLRNCAQVVDRVKYQGFMDARAGNISVEALSQAFDLQLIVSGGTQNTAIEGQSASLSPMWSDEYAMICKIAAGSDFREPGVGRTFHWGEDGSEIGGLFETYRDETVRGDIARVRHDVDEKILYVAAGHLLSNVTT